MNPSEKANADNVAAQIALLELVRLVISEMCFDNDPSTFRKNIIKFEEAAVSGIVSRRHFPNATDEIEEYVKGSASGVFSNLLASIVHPTAWPK